MPNKDKLGGVQLSFQETNSLKCMHVRQKQIDMNVDGVHFPRGPHLPTPGLSYIWGVSVYVACLSGAIVKLASQNRSDHGGREKHQISISV